MKRRLITVILFAVLAAAGSSTILYKTISANARKPAGPEMTRVVVAARDLNAGALIAEGDVHEVSWPVVAGGSPWIKRKEDVVGRGLVTAISKDEPFAESRVAPKGAGAGMASRIPPGMRAVAVHVDELTGLSRFIFPGMHVDVISTGSASGGSQGMVARTILQNVEVFSSGQTVERDAKERPAAVPVFNLLVTPEQAEVLSQAVAQTRIELVLRNPLDIGSFASAANAPPKPAPAPKPARSPARVAPEEKSVVYVQVPAAPTIEVIHGSKRTVSAVTTSGTQGLNQ